MAGAYGVSIRTAEIWRRHGLPALVLPGRGGAGKAVRFEPAAVAAWLAAQQQDAAPAEAPPRKRGRPRRVVASTGGGAA